MNYIFKFPDIGEGIHEGRIVLWYVTKGQKIRSGDAVVKMETDKVVTDIPSPRDGVVVARHGGEGDLVNVGDALIEIALEGEGLPETPDSHSGTTEVVQEKGFGVVGSLEVAGNAAYLPASEEGQSEMPASKESGRRKKVLATPVARALAKDLGVKIEDLDGSGPAGRVMKADVMRAAEGNTREGQKLRLESPSEPAVSGIIVEPLSQIRKTIARNMIRSKQSAAHMTIFEPVEVDRLVDLRRRLNEKLAQDGDHLTYLPFVFKAVAAALLHFPTLNSRMDLEKGQLIRYEDVHINMAVDTDEGLTVPVLRDVGKKNLIQLSREIADYAKRAQEKALSLSDLQGGTFTVTNYGAIGGSYGVPVINYPQAAILGVGRIMKSPVVRGDQIVVGQVLPLSLSVDHRIVDGAEATRFLHRVMGYLNEPDTLLLA